MQVCHLVALGATDPAVTPPQGAWARADHSLTMPRDALTIGREAQTIKRHDARSGLDDINSTALPRASSHLRPHGRRHGSTAVRRELRKITNRQKLTVSVDRSRQLEQSRLSSELEDSIQVECGCVGL